MSDMGLTRFTGKLWLGGEATVGMGLAPSVGEAAIGTAYRWEKR